jgi:hypothetical protein
VRRWPAEQDDAVVLALRGGPHAIQGTVAEPAARALGHAVVARYNAQVEKAHRQTRPHEHDRRPPRAPAPVHQATVRGVARAEQQRRRRSRRAARQPGAQQVAAPRWQFPDRAAGPQAQERFRETEALVEMTRLAIAEHPDGTGCVGFARHRLRCSCHRESV